MRTCFEELYSFNIEGKSQKDLLNIFTCNLIICGEGLDKFSLVQWKWKWLVSRGAARPVSGPPVRAGVAPWC